MFREKPKTRNGRNQSGSAMNKHGKNGRSRLK